MTSPAIQTGAGADDQSRQPKGHAGQGNPFEAAARQTKAFKIACHLHKHRITVEELPLIEDGQWAELAKALGLNPPSAETRAVAARMLGEMERAAA